MSETNEAQQHSSEPVIQRSRSSQRRACSPSRLPRLVSSAAGASFIGSANADDENLEKLADAMRPHMRHMQIMQEWHDLKERRMMQIRQLEEQRQLAEAEEARQKQEREQAEIARRNALREEAKERIRRRVEAAKQERNMSQSAVACPRTPDCRVQGRSLSTPRPRTRTPSRLATPTGAASAQRPSTPAEVLMLAEKRREEKLRQDAEHERQYYQRIRAISRSRYAEEPPASSRPATPTQTPSRPASRLRSRSADPATPSARRPMTPAERKRAESARQLLQKSPALRRHQFRPMRFPLNALNEAIIRVAAARDRLRAFREQTAV